MKGGTPVWILACSDAQRADGQRWADSQGLSVVASFAPADVDDVPSGAVVLADRAALDDVRDRAALIDRASGLFVFGTPDGPFSQPDRAWRGAVKRAIDVVGAVLGLVVLSPVLAVAALAIAVTGRGGVLFRQERLGRHGHRFKLVKLRTMFSGNDDSMHRRYLADLAAGRAETHGGLYKLADDPRITAVGRVLRRLSIDEIPQLWNVLMGDMSLVGPRPMLPHDASLCDGGALTRLRVKPGITGLWQVSGRCELDFAQMLELDQAYTGHWSLGLDMRILAKTPTAVVSARGAA